MGIGWYQGGTRAPPDHPQGGGRGGLYSERLCGTPNIQHPTSNTQRAKAEQNHPKRLPASLFAGCGSGIRRRGRDVYDPGRLRGGVGVALGNGGAVEGLVILDGADVNGSDRRAESGSRNRKQETAADRRVLRIVISAISTSVAKLRRVDCFSNFSFSARPAAPSPPKTLKPGAPPQRPRHPGLPPDPGGD